MSARTKNIERGLFVLGSDKADETNAECMLVGQTDFPG